VFNIGGWEFAVILVVALLVLGPDKLPQAARQVGHFVGEFRRVAAGFQNELKNALEEEDASQQANQKAKSAGGPTDQRVIDTSSRDEASTPDDTAH
jgi:sec-independent protein translocase protein TatB